MTSGFLNIILTLFNIFISTLKVCTQNDILTIVQTHQQFRFQYLCYKFNEKYK